MLLKETNEQILVHHPKIQQVVLKRPRQFNLESCLDYINEDELVEVTPENIRLRKRYLTENERRQQYRKNNA